MDGASLDEVEQLYDYKDFAGFLAAFKEVTGHLRTPEDYEVITYRLMEQLKAQNVRHAEVIVSVGVCLWREQDFAAIFEGLERGRQRGEKDFGISLASAPAARHSAATFALDVSIEIGTSVCPRKPSITGNTRRSSSSAVTSAAPGRVL